ncbi:hypothetical protein [Chitinophaga nivalis]|uniref:Siderophore-interacting protein n=1 Tax=Chitinophaga nivalis TaxID=2991709 RepID=A0ABT3IKN1_9BACT|nr:hypothetical protein [Chitinophaga nivalis]MCW3465774.1 hypothetical protein [Chitinophaga nivalis]MCW3484535.1 hypothetical protein [Chitinophaga nivalis]
MQQINEARLLSVKVIAGHTWHLKIIVLWPPAGEQIPGHVLPVFIGHPHESGVVLKKYPLWNYEPIHQVMDIAVSTVNDEVVLDWLRRLSPGDTVYFMNPEKVWAWEEEAAAYYLIGDVNALPFLYELSRELPFSKPSHSLIYAEVAGLFFPDVDRSYPFNYEVVYPYSAGKVVDCFKLNFTKAIPGSIVYLAGDELINQEFIRFFKEEWHFTEKQLKVATFVS